MTKFSTLLSKIFAPTTFPKYALNTVFNEQYINHSKQCYEVKLHLYDCQLWYNYNYKDTVQLSRCHMLLIFGVNDLDVIYL